MVAVEDPVSYEEAMMSSKKNEWELALKAD